MPQAASAHDTFWDFASLMPEITHMLMWAMSDRAIPRSYRTMQGFGVHTYRLVNAEGESHFVKFHWTPTAGTHSLVWDEAVKISGADPDFHRRDLWEAIEAGAYPEYELGVQIFTEEQAEGFTFDVLDATKIVPEELVPVFPVGKLVLNRNPDNFFAETEQVAFCVAHVVPGIDFTNDPLLAGRIHSYVDTQISRLGGAELPRDPDQRADRGGAQQPARRHAPPGDQPRPRLLRAELARRRLSVPGRRGRASCSFPEPREADDHKVRGKPERFADHYTQATLFWNSQTDVEKTHIVKAFRFELSTGADAGDPRAHGVRACCNVAPELAQAVAKGLGMRDLPAPMPKALARRRHAGSHRVAGAVAVRAAGRRRHPDAARRVPRRRRLRRRAPSARWPTGWPAKGRCRASSARARRGRADVGRVRSTSTLSRGRRRRCSTTRSSCRTARRRSKALLADGRALEFVKDQYRHCKTAPGRSARRRGCCAPRGIPEALPDGQPDPGLLIDGQAGAGVVDALRRALAQAPAFRA